MARGGKGTQDAAATIAAEAAKEVARIQAQGAVEAALVSRSGTMGAARWGAGATVAVALIAACGMIINTGVQGAYSTRQAEIAASASARTEPTPKSDEAEMFELMAPADKAEMAVLLAQFQSRAAESNLSVLRNIR